MNAFDIPLRSSFLGCNGFCAANGHYAEPVKPPKAPKPPKPPKRKYTPGKLIDRDALIAYRASGATQAECAERFDTYPRNVRRILQQAKFTRVQMVTIDEAEMRELRAKGQSIESLAAHFGVCYSTIRKRLGERLTPAEARAAMLERRKLTAPPPMLTFSIRMTPEQHAKYLANGGASWIRGLVDAV
jgi:hypothetical protein